VRAYLAALPDYVCRVSVDRYERPGRRAKFRRRDRLKLEVAFVGGRELYGLPGAARLEDGHIDRLTGGSGAMSTGSFAMHLRELFATDRGDATGARMVKEQGREAARLDFRVARNRSGLSVSSGSYSALVGYSATVLLAPETLEPEWLQVRFEEVPERIRLARSVETTTYRRVRIGDREIALPGSTVLELETRSGLGMRNEIQYQDCRRYEADSKVSFGDAVPGTAEAPAAGVPPGTEVTLVLETAVTRESATGDAVTLRVVEGAGIPAGAKVTGHIVRLRRQDPDSNVYLIAMRLEKLEVERRSGPFRARLKGVDGRAYRVMDGGGLLATGRGFPLRAGLRLVWVTE